MHFTFFDEVIGVNLDNNSTYWKISFSAERQCSTLSILLLTSGASIQLHYFFHFVSRGKKIARKIKEFSKHGVIFSDYFQVCFSWKKKWIVENLFVSQRLGWIIAEIFHRKVIHKYFFSWLLLFNITLLITLLIKS